MTSGPFRGLEPFGDDDAALFFGRETDTQVVVANVLGARLTVLYGPSGVGKSSLLRAGVMPRLRHIARSQPLAAVVFGAWNDDAPRALDAEVRAAVTAALGVDPGDAGGSFGERVDGYTAALGGELCLVLDQFEELFATGGVDDVAPLLAELATRPRLRANVVLAVRDDALAQLDAFKPLIPGLFANTLRLDHLSRAGGREAILGPIGEWNDGQTDRGVIAEDALVQAVLDDVRVDEDHVDATYLQLVMQRLWDAEVESGSRVMRRKTLAGMGGARQIVGDHLGRALGGLTEPEQDLASRMFEQLVTASGRKIAHRVVDLAASSEAPPAQALAVLERLASERIVRPLGDSEGDAERYEVHHDTLCEPIAAWAAARRADQALAAERERARERHRRLAILAAAALVAVAVLAALTLYAFAERRTARSETRAARSHEAAATALTQLPVDAELALALAVHAAELGGGTQVDAAVREALLAAKLRTVSSRGPPVAALFRSGRGFAAAGPRRLTRYAADARGIGSVRVEGRFVGVSGDDALFIAGNALHVVSPRTGGATATFRTHAGRSLPVSDLLTGRVKRQVAVPRDVALVALGPRRGLLAEVGARAQKTIVLDVKHDNARYALVQPSRVTSVAFGPGSRTLATGGADGTTRLWRVATGTVRVVLRARGRITAVAFSPRATIVATAGSDGVARVWRTASGDPVAVLSGHTNPITALAFSPDGTSVATASSDGTVRVWKALTGQQLALLQSPGTTVTGLAFNRTGDLLAGAGADGRVRLWDARSQPTLLRYRDLQRPIIRASWEPEGIRAVTDDGVRRIVRVPGMPTPGTPHDLRIRVVRNTVVVRVGKRQLVLRGHTGAVASVHADASGTRLVSASRDGSARIWDVSTGRSLHTLRHFRDVADAEFSPDGRWVVTAGPSTAAVWDARSGRRLFDLRGHTAPLVFASFDRSGRRIYTASVDGTIRRYGCDVCASGDELVTFARARIARTGRTLTRAERLQLLGER